MSNFEQSWKCLHPNSYPVGYMMRGAGDPNWLRFHSLPESKRYADNPDERVLLLARHNRIAAEVFGNGSPLWLVQTCWETPEGMCEASDTQEQFRACRDYDLAWAFRFLVDEDDEDEHAWNVHAAQTVWADGKFDELLWDIANENAAPTIWMSASTGAVFAPYDGGIDLFLPTQELVQRLRASYPEWLSDHPEGL